MNLTDATTRRQAELTQTLAAIATLNPSLACELRSKIRPADLIDERAKKYLQALKPDSNPCILAFELGLGLEYARWLRLACEIPWPVDQTAKAAVDEIKRLVITRQTLAGLGDWLKEAGRIGGYKYAR